MTTKTTTAADTRKYSSPGANSFGTTPASERQQIAQPKLPAWSKYIDSRMRQFSAGR